MGFFSELRFCAWRDVVMRLWTAIPFSLTGKILNTVIEKYMKTHFPNILKIMKYQSEVA